MRKVTLLCKAYLVWIRSLPCAACGRSNHIEAAHTGRHGLGQKSSDLSCIPLCFTCHRGGNESYHALGPAKFSEVYNLNIPELVDALNCQGLAGIKIHSPGVKQVERERLRTWCICGWRSTWFGNLCDAQVALHAHMEENVSRELGTSIPPSRADESIPIID